MLTMIIAALALTTTSYEASDDDRDAAVGDDGPAPVLQLEGGTSIAEQPDTFVLSTAGEYAAFHRIIADLRDAPIGSAADLDQAMDNLTTFYTDDRLVRAWIAYTAMIAAQHPEYLDDVREVADYYGPEAAMSGLMYDPAFATSFTHAREARDSVTKAIARDSNEIMQVSERYREAAYDLQSARWARTRARDRQDRIAAIQNAGERGINLESDVIVTLEQNLGSGRAASDLFTDQAVYASTAGPDLSLTVGQSQIASDRARIGRMLSVAALQAISGDSPHANTAMESLLSDPTVERCLAWVRLDLEQCVAAGHFKYEDSFCIAEHALLDVSRCLSGNSGD